VPGRDTKTKTQGVFARHKQSCAMTADGTGCTCTPVYYGKVYDRATKRYRNTKRYPTVAAARSARNTLSGEVERGETPVGEVLRLRDAYERFSDAIRDGRCLTKHGGRYKPSAVKDITECLKVHVIEHVDRQGRTLGNRRMADLRRGDIQHLVDDLAPRLSGSRVRSVVNAIRSLYRWAVMRDLVTSDPAARVLLPAMNATPRDRVATPLEMETLLQTLVDRGQVADALPYALAVYAMGRRADIQRLTWGQVDRDLGLVAWSDGKTKAATRVVPAVKPLRALLLRAWGAAGKPGPEAKVCPPIRDVGTRLLETGSLAKRARTGWGWKLDADRKTWTKARPDALEPIGLHECRHTAATWMDHAGVSPKIASVLMGHETPERQAGAAHITLARYTHALPAEYEKARVTLDAWIAAEVARERRALTA
jgi:integrase